MRPIKLSFAGLNSYAKQQEIDFERLTEAGLFGIFGPTGSGKSTILDAITIALYGSIARKSKEYLNTNCDELYVAFRFRLTSQEGMMDFTAERRFSRSKDTGNVRAKHVRLIQHGNSDEILSEKTTEMNNQVIDLLGLTMDDFTRSVVLPQGQFSNFLKLSGKDRRSMLERIFGLEKYGLQLGIRLKAAHSDIYSKQQYINGQLDRYADFSEDGLKDLKTEQKMQELAYEELSIELSKLEEEYNKATQIYNLQLELQTYEEKVALMKERRLVVQQQKIDLERSEKAALIKPLLDEIMDYNRTIEEGKVQLDSIKEQLKGLKQKQESFTDKLVKVEDFENNQLPKWQEQKGQYKEATQYEKRLDDLQNQLVHLRIHGDQLKSKNENSKQSQNEIKGEFNRIQEHILLMEEEEKDCTIKSGYRELIDKGTALEERKTDLTRTKEELEQMIHTMKQRIVKGHTVLQDLLCQLEPLKKEEKELEEQMSELKNNKPLDIQELARIQEQIVELTKELDEVVAAREETIKLEKEKLLFQEETKVKEKDLVLVNKEKTKLEAKKDELEIIREEQKGKYIAAMIAHELQEGDPCPVCGAVEHVNLATLDKDHSDHELKEAISNLSKEIEIIEVKKQDLQVAVITYEQNVERINNQLSINEKVLMNRDIEVMSTQVKAAKDKLKEAREWHEKWQLEKQNCDKKNTALKDKQNSLQQEVVRTKEGLAHLEEQLELNQEKNDKLKKELEEVCQKLSTYMTDHAISSFIVERQVIADKDRRLTEIKNNRSRSESVKASLQKKLDELGAELTKQEVNIATNNKELEFSEKEVVDLKIKVNAICGEGISATAALDALEKKIQHYIEGAKKVRDILQSISEEVNEKVIESTQVEAKIRQVTENKEKQVNKAETARTQYKFMSMDDVLKAYMDDDRRQSLADMIKTFEEEAAEIITSINRIKEKLDSRVIDIKDYSELKAIRETAGWKRDHMLKMKSETSTKLIQYEKAMAEVGDLIKEKAGIDHQLNMLEDLRNLVKGNKFVEFVAQNQFHYIVHEASKRLYDLTGRYGLELDESNEFRIRDDKNGGALREAATLSGGETFLTSLALALALSSHIQLKGSYPLEFFFLDEGFGTLDTELLDVVMTSLEKLNSSHMNVGIISHVEELKNRVPVKLVITPSELGGDGSSIKLEYS